MQIKVDEDLPGAVVQMLQDSRCFRNEKEITFPFESLQRLLKNHYTEHTEETQSITKHFSAPLCVISVKLCVQNSDFLNHPM